MEVNSVDVCFNDLNLQDNIFPSPVSEASPY